MRPWTISILGAVAFSLAAPATADARPRFGPGMILGAFTAPLAMLSGGRSGAAQRESAQRHQHVAENEVGPKISGSLLLNAAQKETRVLAGVNEPLPDGEQSAN